MTYFKKLILFLLIIVPPFHSFAQEFEEELREAIHKRPTLEARYDSRNSFVNQTGVRVSGFKLGVQFDNKLSFGLGYNFLSSSIKKDIISEGNLYYVELEFRYFSPYIEYVFYRDNKWELSIPVQFGFGTSYYGNENEAGPDKFNEGFIMTYEPAIAFQYRFLKYFGAGFGVGYRLMVKPNRQIDEKLTSPVYIFKLKLYFQDLMRDL